MKKRLVICLLAAISIFSVSFFDGRSDSSYVETYTKDIELYESKPDVEEVKVYEVKETNASVDFIENEEDAVDEPEIINEPKEVKTYEDTYALLEDKGIWIGDSRSVLMEEHVGVCEYIAKGAKFYTWWKSDAIPRLKEKLNEDDDRIVIVNFGVNDCANYRVGHKSNNASKYSQDVNELIKAYPNTKFYFLSVTPVSGPYRTKYRESGQIPADEVNEEIERFNDTIKNECAATYIDVNSYLKENGFNAFDGIHYSIKTDKDIFEFVAGKLAEN